MYSTYIQRIEIALLSDQVMAGQGHAPSHPGVLQNANMNGNILQRYLIHNNF